MSKPDSIGRWIHGLANVLSETEIDFRLRAIFATASRSINLSSGLLGVSTQTMRVFGLIARSRSFASVMSIKVKSRLAERRRTFSNKPEGAAVKIVAHDDMRAAVDHLERGRHRGETGSEGQPARSAFEIGDATFVGEPGRIDRARVIVAFVSSRGFPARTSTWRKSAS